MKHWKCTFEAQKGHPDYEAPNFELNKWVVVQSKFKGGARQLAEDALKIWDSVAPDKYRVPIIEQATDVEVQTYERRLTGALHNTEQTGGSLNGSEQATSENTLQLHVYDYPLCEPYSVYVGIYFDEQHEDYRCSTMMSNRLENRVIDGDLSYLSDIAYPNLVDALSIGLTEAITAIEQTHADLLGSDFKPSIQILKGYRTLSENQQADQYAYTLQIEASPEAEPPHDDDNPSNHEDRSDESCANPQQTNGVYQTTDHVNAERINAEPIQRTGINTEPEPSQPQTLEQKIFAAVEICINKNVNKVPCPTVEQCAQNLLALIDQFDVNRLDVNGLCRDISEQIKNPFVMVQSTVALNLVMKYLDYDANQPQSEPQQDPLEPLMQAIQDNASFPKVPNDFEQKVYQNLQDLAMVYALPIEELCQHILSMDDISELYEFGHCEELIGFYIQSQDKVSHVNGKANEKEAATSYQSPLSEHDEAVAALNKELEALEVGQTIYKDDLPSKVYHAAIGISSTNLKEELISSEYRHNLEVGEIERPDEHHFSFGNYIHTLLLQPELVDVEYCFERELPDGGYTTIESMKIVIQAHNEDTGDKVAVSGTKADLAARIRSFDPDAVFKHELDELWQKEKDTGLIPVSLDDKERGERIVKSAMNNPAIRNWYAVQSANTKCERSYFTKVKIDLDGPSIELVLKARLDKEIGAFIIDTKTIELWRDIKEEDAEGYLNREIEKRGYHLSAAHYLAVTGKTRFYWIFHNKLKGYEWEVIMEASEEHLMLGRFDREKALHSIAQSMLTGQYPPPVRQPLTPDGKPTPLMSRITRYGMKRLEDYHMAKEEEQGGYYHE